MMCEAAKICEMDEVVEKLNEITENFKDLNMDPNSYNDLSGEVAVIQPSL